MRERRPPANAVINAGLNFFEKWAALNDLTHLVDAIHEEQAEQAEDRRVEGMRRAHVRKHGRRKSRR
jgi:hypothetical protein